MILGLAILGSIVAAIIAAGVVIVGGGERWTRWVVGVMPPRVERALFVGFPVIAFAIAWGFGVGVSALPWVAGAAVLIGVAGVFISRRITDGLKRAGYFSLAVLSLEGAWLWTWRDSGFIGPEAPAPPDTLDPWKPEHKAEILRHAKGLPWDTVTHGAADSMFLDTLAIIGSDTVSVPTGIRGEIVPVKGFHRTDKGDLENGKRVQLRITITYPPGVSPGEGYPLWQREEGRPPVYLKPGVHYFWYDRLRMDSRHYGRMRASIVPDLDQPVRDSLVVRFAYHRKWWWNMAMAQWSFKHGSGWTWHNCTTNGCCES